MSEAANLPTLVVERDPVEGICPECHHAELRRYPVLSDGGWFVAVKCQRCLYSISREPWNRLGYVVRLEDVL
jgi:vanillate/4-hydroxybenzoate decarboxylase subunit D